MKISAHRDRLTTGFARETAIAALALAGSMLLALGPAPAAAQSGTNADQNTGDRPNFVIITTDDMNWDSVGAFGSEVPNITPNIDRLAKQGMRFNRAHVTTSVCVPTREAMFTGTWPHNNGSNVGFFGVRENVPTMHAQLQEAGYFTGQVGKEHLNPRDEFPTDYRTREIKEMHYGRYPELYRKYFAEALTKARKSGKPFMIHVGLFDPHAPYAGHDHLGPHGQGDLRSGDTPPAPVPRKVKPENVTLPDYADEIPFSDKEYLADYYSSVYRADISVGHVMDLLKKRGFAKNTVVIFLSDHGWMLGTHGKLTLYPDGTKTPLIVRWPGVTKPGSVDRTHFINMMDLTPTVLDIAGLPDNGADVPARTFRPLLEGESQSGRDRVFTEYNGGYSGKPMRFFHPERAVQDGKRLYYFRPHMVDGSDWHKHKNAELEEFYDLTEDPHAVNNVIDDPQYQDEVAKYRQMLYEHLRRTDDPAAKALRNVDSPQKLKQWMKQQKQKVKEKDESG